MTSYCRLK